MGGEIPVGGGGVPDSLEVDEGVGGDDVPDDWAEDWTAGWEHQPVCTQCSGSQLIFIPGHVALFVVENLKKNGDNVSTIETYPRKIM